MTDQTDLWQNWKKYDTNVSLEDLEEYRKVWGDKESFTKEFNKEMFETTEETSRRINLDNMGDERYGNYGDYHKLWGDRDEEGNVKKGDQMTAERRINKDEDKLQAGYAAVYPYGPSYPHTPWTPQKPVGVNTVFPKPDRIYGTRVQATASDLNGVLDKLLSEGWQSFDITTSSVHGNLYYIVPSISREEAVRRAKKDYPNLDIS